MLFKAIKGLIGLLLLIDLNPPAAFCQQPSSLGMGSIGSNKTPEKRVYVRRVLRPNRLGGVAVVNYFGSGIGLGYDRILTRDFHLGFTGVYTQARLQGSTGFDAEEFLDGDMIRLSFTPRYFIWRNLYAGAGVHVSSVSGKFGFFGDAVINSPADTDFSAMHVNSDVLLGNEWRFGRVFLAVDWVGVSFFQASSVSVDDNPALSELSRFFTGDEPAGRVEQEIAAQLTLTYLSARIGVSF